MQQRVIAWKHSGARAGLSRLRSDFFSAGTGGERPPGHSGKVASTAWLPAATLTKSVPFDAGSWK